MNKGGDQRLVTRYIISIILGIAFIGVLGGCVHKLQTPNCDLTSVDLQKEFVDQYQNCGENCEFDYTNLDGEHSIKIEEHKDGVLIYLECFGRKSDHDEIIEGNVCFYDGEVKKRGEVMDISHFSEFKQYKYRSTELRDYVKLENVNGDLCFVENIPFITPGGSELKFDAL